MKKLTLPEGAFTEAQLEQLNLAKPNLSEHRFYLVRYNSRNRPSSGHDLVSDVGVVEPCYGRSLQFTAGDVFYYFDNYFYAFACGLKLLKAKHE